MLVTSGGKERVNILFVYRSHSVWKAAPKVYEIFHQFSECQSMLEKAPVGEEMSPVLSMTEKQEARLVTKTKEDLDKGRFWRHV